MVGAIQFAAHGGTGATRPSTSAASPLPATSRRRPRIERAELLLADPQWLEADREAEAAYWAAAEAKRKEQELRDCIQRLTEYGCPDLAAALEQGLIKPFVAFMEMRRRRDAA